MNPRQALVRQPWADGLNPLGIVRTRVVLALCAVPESQRDSVPKPRVVPQARDYPGLTLEENHNPSGVAANVARASNGYQYEPGYESTHGFSTRQLHQPATVRKKAWKIATAGGYFAAGFAGTAVARDFTQADINNFRPAALEALYNFFTTKTEYWKMSPHLALVASHNVLLALPGTEYVAYFPRGGTNYVQLAAGRYRAEWFHPETGRYVREPDLSPADGRRNFVPPLLPNDDWVLHLRRRDW